jgi:hypothetical protein
MGKKLLSATTVVKKGIFKKDCWLLKNEDRDKGKEDDSNGEKQLCWPHCKGCPMNHPYASIISRINLFKMWDWEVVFQHIYIYIYIYIGRRTRLITYLRVTLLLMSIRSFNNPPQWLFQLALAG